MDIWQTVGIGVLVLLVIGLGILYWGIHYLQKCPKGGKHAVIKEMQLDDDNFYVQIITCTKCHKTWTAYPI